MAYVYRERIVDGMSTARFVVLRLARLYPVHIFMLAAFLGLETFKLILDGFGALPLRSPPFSAERVSGESFAANLVLMQALGQFEKLTWNETSWSISIEFYLYIVFALICLAGILQTWLGRACLALSVAGVLAYLTTQNGDLDFYNDNAFGRRFVGFMMGALLHSMIAMDWASRLLSEAKVKAGTAIEITALVLICLFVANAQGVVSFAAPFVFFGFVLVCLDNQGALSRFFSHRWFGLLAALSYSVYMSHFLSCQPMRAVVVKYWIDGVMWPATFAFPIFLILTLGISYCMYRLVETPTRDAMRAWIERHIPARASARPGLIARPHERRLYPLPIFRQGGATWIRSRAVAFAAR